MTGFDKSEPEIAASRGVHCVASLNKDMMALSNQRFDNKRQKPIYGMV